MEAYNRRAAHKDETLDECTIRLAAVSDLTAYDSEIQRVSDEITSLVEESKRLIEENARSPHNQEEYQHRHKALTERYNQACMQLTELQDQRNRCIDSQKSIEWFMDAFEHKEGLMESFDEEIFFSVLDYMTVYADGKVTVRFRDGAEVVIEGRKCR